MSLGDDVLGPADLSALLQLQRLALEYFLDNQTPCGLMLDRQSNHGPRRSGGLCSTAATGMGFIALALASAPPHQVVTAADAAARVRAGLVAVLEGLPHDEGVVPHFLDSGTGEVIGHDYFSTVETAWLAAGALWAGAFLADAELQALADRLYERVHWHYWTAPESANASGLLRHGKDREGRFLGCSWDRANGETVFMYVLAAGAAEGKAVSGSAWGGLRPFYGSVAGERFNNADLGLFVFQYGLDLLDLRSWRAPCGLDLHAEARLATAANERACRLAAGTFGTYRQYWGLSAGDGPDGYRSYAPGKGVDGTAHLTATLASAAHAPPAVLENVHQARRETRFELRGRYGLSNVNLDRGWVGRDVVGIDLGALVLGLDNYLTGGRVRAVFHTIPCVQSGLQRLGFTAAPDVQPTATAPVRRAS